MGIFEVICVIGGALLGAITGMAAGIKLPEDIDSIKKALKGDDLEE